MQWFILLGTTYFFEGYQKERKKKLITLEICGDGAKLNQPTLVTSSKSIRHPSSSQDGQQRLSGQCHNAT